MTDQVLGALRFLFLALVYLFFARVLWAVWSEVRSPAARPAHAHRTDGSGPRVGKGAGRRKGTTVVVMVEPRHRRGENFTVSNVLTIGRDDDNDISSPDDSFMSGRHARLELRPEGIWIVDLDSTNGTFVNGQRVAGDRSIRKGDRLQAGSTVLEVRS